MGNPVAAMTALPAGLGTAFRRELLLRALVAVLLATVFFGAALYGVLGIADDVDLGVPFVVVGAVGALTHAVLVVAMLWARSAVASAAYRTVPVVSARRFSTASLTLLGLGAVVAVLATLANLGAQLAGLAALGLLGVAGTALPGWAVLGRLESHTTSTSTHLPK